MIVNSEQQIKREGVYNEIKWLLLWGKIDCPSSDQSGRQGNDLWWSVSRHFRRQLKKIWQLWLRRIDVNRKVSALFCKGGGPKKMNNHEYRKRTEDARAWGTSIVLQYAEGKVILLQYSRQENDWLNPVQKLKVGKTLYRVNSELCLPVVKHLIKGDH